MKSDTSFSQKQKAGWTAEQLRKYYALSDIEYERIVACVERIKGRVAT